MSEKKTSGIKNFFEEFKAFAMRGNVLDMAVGVVVGSAFTAIVNSLVNDIISPIIGLFFNADFSDVVIQIGDVGIGVGAFLNAIINFLIVASVLFLTIKAINMLHKKTVVIFISNKMHYTNLFTLLTVNYNNFLTSLKIKNTINTINKANPIK